MQTSELPPDSSPDSATTLEAPDSTDLAAAAAEAAVAEVAAADEEVGTRPWRPSSFAVGVLVRVCAYIVAGCAVIAVSSNVVGPETQAAALVVAPLVYVVVTFLASYERRILVRTTPLEPVPSVERLLGPTGVQRVTMRMGRPDQARDYCYRRGSRAWIVLSPWTLSVRHRWKFVLFHEMAHIARRDSDRFRVDLALSAAMLWVGVLSARWVAFALAVALVIFGRITSRWAAEIACDTLGSRRAGLPAIIATFNDMRALRRVGPNRRLGRRMRRSLGILRHPPLRARVAVQRRRA